MYLEYDAPERDAIIRDIVDKLSLLPAEEAKELFVNYFKSLLSNS